ncbi:MAG TPA: hypothetical protein VII56_22445 [Rhizomicrobium sp.]
MTSAKKQTSRGKTTMADFAPKTDAALLERLNAAAKRGLTKNELHMQRVSFVYGNLPTDSTLTRQQVAAELAKGEGEKNAA